MTRVTNGMPRFFLALVALFWVTGGCARWAEIPGSGEVSRGVPGEGDSLLGSLMIQRLQLAQKVAFYKLVNQLPVADSAREEIVLQSVVARAVADGISPELAERFFRAQISASRLLQHELIRHWRRGGELPAIAPFSLSRDVRPEIDRIGDALIAELAVAPPESLNHKELLGQLRAAGFSWRVAWTASRGFRHEPSRGTPTDPLLPR